MLNAVKHLTGITKISTRSTARFFPTVRMTVIDDEKATYSLKLNVMLNGVKHLNVIPVCHSAQRGDSSQSLP